MGEFDTDIPSWTANHIVTDAEAAVVTNLLSASHLDGGLVNDNLLFKANPQTYVNNAALTDDTVFQYALQGSAVYAFDMFVPYTTVAAALFRSAWRVPSGATGEWMAAGLSNSVTTTTGGIWDAGSIGLTVAHTMGTSGAANTAFIARGFINVTTAGNFVYQHSQLNSNAGTTGVRAGAWCSVKRIA